MLHKQKSSKPISVSYVNVFILFTLKVSGFPAGLEPSEGLQCRGEAQIRTDHAGETVRRSLTLTLQNSLGSTAKKCLNRNITE